MVVKLSNCVEYMTHTPFKISPVYPITKCSHFVILEDIFILLTNGKVIKIPKDFVFDGSSSPRFLWSLFASYGDFLLAALIHDFLYKTDYMRLILGDYEAQLFADNEMYVWSKVLNPKHPIDNKARYKAVRTFGKSTYVK